MPKQSSSGSRKKKKSPSKNTKSKKTPKPKSPLKEEAATSSTHEDVFASEESFSHAESDTNTEVVFEDSFGQQDERFADDLSAIYESDGDEVENIDMNTFEQKRKRGKVIAIVVAAIVLFVGIAYLGYRVFGSVAEDEEAGNVEFALDAPQEVASGESVTLEFSYTNERETSISGDLEIFYPTGFILQQSSREPESEDGRIFRVDELNAGGSQTITVTGQLVGSTDTEKEFSALFTYQPSNFSSDFQESAETTIKITSSLIDVEIDAPEQAQSGEEITITGTFENTSDSEMQNVQVTMVYPEGFSVTQTVPETSEDDDEWFFDSVAAKSNESLSVTGTISADSGTSEDFTMQVGIVDDGEFTLQSEETISMTVVNPEIDLSLEVPDVASAGDTIPVNVTVNNTSESDLQNVDILLSLDDTFFTESESTLSIDSLTPGESETLTSELIIQDEPSSANREGFITATIPSALVEGSELQFPNEASATVKLQSSFAIGVSGGSSENGGAPVVGETTFYTIQWTVENGEEAVEGFRISATLPDNVEWAGDASSGITYDSSSNEVYFEKDELKAGFQNDFQFTVSVTPKKKDVGATIQLTNEVNAYGVDAFTGQDITFFQPAIQTDQAVEEKRGGISE